MSRMGLRVVTIAVLSVSVGCNGATPSTPTEPAPATTANPMVRIEMTYTCHPCTNDPDNYALRIGDGGAVFRNENTTSETDTLVWTGSLPPGRRTIEVRIVNAETSWRLAFMAVNQPENTGGIRRSSVRILDDVNGGRDVKTLAPCGLVTAFPSRPPTLYEFLLDVEVVLGTGTTIC